MKIITSIYDGFKIVQQRFIHKEFQLEGKDLQKSPKLTAFRIYGDLLESTLRLTQSWQTFSCQKIEHQTSIKLMLGLIKLEWKARELLHEYHQSRDPQGQHSIL